MGKAENGDIGKKNSGRIDWTKREEGYRI